ncbi:uncharacterized protein H6S33_007845 [Morchella sextelata]|uniref:uncharacterized protein n=1 Tax=Morchella sextelata TaxID=1174677 RepID=UPI001D04C4E5|nr:uncharacterized protein H6S33_007845 [Morchella sextelata]KAH0603523.1 hypothetical protein H6S33_007845 [Morchella sextelata]
MESQWGKRNVRRRNFSKGGEPSQDTPPTIMPSATMEQHPTMLFLPGGYSEEQLGSLLSHAVNSPKIMNSNAMVTVIDAPPLGPASSATDEDSFFREFLVDDPDDPDGTIDNTWGSPVDKSSETIPAETMSREMSSAGIAPAKIMPIEISAAEITPDEIMPIEISSDNITPVSDIPSDNFSDVMETMFGVDSPQDVGEFEKSQEKQFLAVMTAIKPLEQVLGEDSVKSAEPVDIPMIETKGTVYQQEFCQPDEISGGIQDYIPPEIGISRKDALLKLSAKEIEIEPFGPAPADNLRLEVLGARPNTICATCLHRGHTQNSTKLCPFKMISVAISKMKTRGRKKRIDDVTKEVGRLQKLVDDVGPGVKGIRNIMNLLDEWHETIEKNVAWGKSKAPATSPSVPIGFVDYKIADTFAAILQEGDSSNSHVATNLPRNFSPEVVDGSTYTHRAPEPRQSSYVSLENNAEPSSFTSQNSNNGITYPENLNQLYGTFDDREGISDFCDQDFGASSHDTSASLLAAVDNQPRFQEETQKIISTPQAYRRISSSNTSTSQMLVDSTPAPAEEWEESSQDELPPDILWRQKCTLRTIGVRGDNLCKSCLHYGHDRSSYACPAQLVLRSILAGDDVSSTASSVEDLRSAIEWQKSIPKDIQGDYKSIQSLVHRWEVAVKQSKSEMFETAVDNPVRKRRCRSAILENQPAKSQFRKEQVPNSPSLVRMGYKGQQIASPVPMQINYKDQLHVTSAKPMHMDYANQYITQNVPVQQQRDFPQEVLPTKKCTTASEGVFFDYHRIPGHLLSMVMDYVIEESGEGNEDRLLVDHRKMPKALFLNLRSYLSKDPEPAAIDQQPKKCDKRKRT